MKKLTADDVIKLNEMMETASSLVENLDEMEREFPDSEILVDPATIKLREALPKEIIFLKSILSEYK